MKAEEESHFCTNNPSSVVELHQQNPKNIDDDDDDDAAGILDSLLHSPFPPPARGWLLFFKTLYFLSGLSAATWGRYGVIYCDKVKHLISPQIGWCSGIMPLVGFVAMPEENIVS
jgi:hypothetical protein